MKFPHNDSSRLFEVREVFVSYEFFGEVVDSEVALHKLQPLLKVECPTSHIDEIRDVEGGFVVVYTVY